MISTIKDVELQIESLKRQLTTLKDDFRRFATKTKEIQVQINDEKPVSVVPLPEVTVDGSTAYHNIYRIFIDAKFESVEVKPDSPGTGKKKRTKQGEIYPMTIWGDCNLIDGVYRINGVPIDFGGGSVTWDEVTGKPTEFPPSAHTHVWADITGIPTVFPSEWSIITNKPTTFPPSAHNHPWTDITSLPATFPSDWNTTINKPATFTATPHTHPWTDITGKPSTFPPDPHTHDWGQITGKPDYFYQNYPNNAIFNNTVEIKGNVTLSAGAVGPGIWYGANAWFVGIDGGNSNVWRVHANPAGNIISIDKGGATVSCAWNLYCPVLSASSHVYVGDYLFVGNSGGIGGYFNFDGSGNVLYFNTPGASCDYRFQINGAGYFWIQTSAVRCFNIFVCHPVGGEGGEIHICQANGNENWVLDVTAMGNLRIMNLNIPLMYWQTDNTMKMRFGSTEYTLSRDSNGFVKAL